MLDENVKTLIGWWKLKGQRETDPFIKFFFFYVCFDAWITNLSQKDIDQEKLDWFLNNDNCLKAHWPDIQSSITKSWIKNLSNLSPIFDMRPNHRERSVVFDDVEDFEQMIRFIYQIRCNLFHGGKDAMNSRDSNLVDLAGKILEKWIIWAYHKCG